MTVGELKDKLNQFTDDTEVLITDGYLLNCYRGAYLVVEYTDMEGAVFCDIGIGHCLEE